MPPSELFDRGSAKRPARNGEVRARVQVPLTHLRVWDRGRTRLGWQVILGLSDRRRGVHDKIFNVSSFL